MSARDDLQKYPVAEVLGGLIRLDTQNPPGNERAAVNYILSLMEGKDAQVTVIDHQGNRASLVIRIEGKKRGGTAFLGHLDTVPVGSEEWLYKPLDMTVSGDRAYGRGASDMKGGVTAILMALSYLLDNSITPERDVYAALTADEESGLMGIRAVRQSGLLDGVDEIIVGEPTDCHIGVAEKGALWIRLKSRGEQTHGAMPDMGVNAIEMLAECISLFKGKCAEVLKNVHAVLGKPSVSTTMMHGGMHCNIVPKDCTAVVDIRTTSRKEHEAFLAALKQATAEAGEAYGGSVTYEIVNERPALETPAGTRLIQTLGQQLRAAGKKPEHIGVAYYTDLSGLMDDSNKPFAIVGPGHQSMMHKEDEYITISDIATMAEVYVDYILSK